ncbi:MFS transporter [Pseudomonas inefficax]
MCGFAPVPSATAYGVLSAVNLGGMILAGWLTDRVNRPILLFTIYVARALCFGLLLVIGDNYELLLSFAVLFGIFDYSTVPVTASLLSSRLGLRNLGLSLGLLSAGHAIGGASGAFFGGWVFDHTGEYLSLWYVSIMLAGLAAALIILLREEREPAGTAQVQDA